ncbi:MAG: Ig-like domain-containing protein, partial [Patescibacteria group bacterium]
YPDNNQNFTSLPITFSAIPVDPDDANTLNVSIWGNWSGVWAINVSNASSLNNTQTNFSIDGIPNGKYIWSASVKDTGGATLINTTNYTFTKDTVAPVITLPFYANGTLKQNTETLTLNISVSDATTNPSACKIDINGTNQTVSVSNGWCNITNGFLTNLVDGNKTINVYANDSANNFGLNNSFVVKIITANSAPTIPFVQAIADQNATESSYTGVVFNFSVNDTNGASDINISSVRASFNQTGEATRSNTSCVNISSGGNGVMFTCNVSMFYFDNAGVWSINVSARDNSEAGAGNSTTNFTYNLLTAMVISPASLAWPSPVNLTDTDTGSNNDPITINNTGNALNLSINVTAYNLRGESDTSKFIFANNFTVENASQGCSGTAMSNATSLKVTTANLSKGNNSLNYGNETSGQEQTFFCLKGIPQDATQQSYSSAFYGSWEIRILLVALLPRRRKKEENEDIIENLGIPITIFSEKIGALETITKYLKENLGMSYHLIAEVLNRDQRTIWTSYKKA